MSGFSFAQSSAGASKPSTNDTGGAFGGAGRSQGTSGGLFTSSNPSNNGGGGLFGTGSSSTQPHTTGSIFGQAPARAKDVFVNPFPGGFGSTTAQTGGLFGNPNNTQQGGGLFGNAQPRTDGSLFGQSTTQNNNPGGGVLGANQTTSSGSLSGNKPQQANQNNSFDIPRQSESTGRQFASPLPPHGQHTIGGNNPFDNKTQPQNSQQGGLFSNNQTTSPFGTLKCPFEQGLGPFASRLATYASDQVQNTFGSAFTQPAPLTNSPSWQQTCSCRPQKAEASAAAPSGIPRPDEIREPVEYSSPRFDYIGGPGTSILFHPYREQVPYCSSGTAEVYQQIVMMPEYRVYSPEELRLMDYNLGRQSCRSSDTKTKKLEIQHLKARIAVLEAEIRIAENVSSPREIRKGDPSIPINPDPRTNNSGIAFPPFVQQSTNVDQAVVHPQRPLPRLLQPAQPKQPEIAVTATTTITEASLAEVLNGKVLPGQKEPSIEANPQERRLQDIEAQLAKVTALLEKQILAAPGPAMTIKTLGSSDEDKANEKEVGDTTTTSSASVVVFTPGSSTDTISSLEVTTEGFVDVGAKQATAESTNNTSNVTDHDLQRLYSASQLLAMVQTQKVMVEQAFKDCQLPGYLQKKLSCNAQDIWFVLRSRPTVSISAVDISTEADILLRDVFKAAGELIEQGLATAIDDEDAFTIAGGPKSQT